jgi:hypothetical protein
MMDNSIHIQGIGIVLQVPRDNANLVVNGLISWVDYMKLNYNMIPLI